MSRLFRFLLLPASAGAVVAFSRRNREEPQPFFADARPAAILPEEAPFVADLREPDPSSAQTDTWSGRAIGS
jgi:hypothetical protein